MPTCQDIITGALLEIGILTQPGQTPSPEHSAFGMAKLNRLIGQWSTRKLMIWTIRSDRYALVPGQSSYTLGPSGGNWIGARPVGIGPGKGIENANIVNVTASPEYSSPVAILDKDQWASKTIKEVSTEWPTQLYNDGAVPLTTIHVYGTPTAAHKLELWTPQQIAVFSTLTDTFDWPAAYQECATLWLAESLCSPFGRPLTPELAELSRRAKAAVQSLNSAPPKLSTDVPAGGGAGPYFSYRSGKLI